ncbi:hypothetical protein JZO73_13700 [Enterococcus plantarum]|uniref:hypothetical protein n=1 Tax=Enterococcus plantarum TaxID=1077675 RepID=UPI001A8D0D33|nr:hypothetical protein [Enterococcus plantarum]MBO0468558.1 hypothetical protein [Enterococcus plantarum]
MEKEPLAIFKDRRFQHFIDGTTEQIAAYIVRANPEHKYAVVTIDDELICSTIGNFLDHVPNQQWLIEELQPTLIAMQFNQIEIPKVPLYSKEQATTKISRLNNSLATAQDYPWMQQSFLEWGKEQVFNQLKTLRGKEIDAYFLDDELWNVSEDALFKTHEEASQFAFFHPLAAKRALEGSVELSHAKLNPFLDIKGFGRFMYRQALEEMYGGLEKYTHQFDDPVKFDFPTIKKILSDAKVTEKQLFFKSFYTDSTKAIPADIDIDATPRVEKKQKKKSINLTKKIPKTPPKKKATIKKDLER